MKHKEIYVKFLMPIYLYLILNDNYEIPNLHDIYVTSKKSYEQFCLVWCFNESLGMYINNCLSSFSP